MAIMILDVNNLTGGYSREPVLKDLSFQINEGEIVGLIGLNGAGKSTTIKHIIGLLQPMSGSIHLNDVSLIEDNQTYRQSFSYLPELPVLYEELTLREHLELTALSYGLDKETAIRRIQPLLEQFRLWERLDWLPIHFSKGMKQKVMIVCAFLVDTSLYIVDEPFLGLDPLATNDFIHLLEERKQEGSAILMSTHELQRAEQYCDRYLFLQSGRLIAQGSLSELQTHFGLPQASLEEIYLTLAKESLQ